MLFNNKAVFASNSAVIVNPIRGSDFWQQNYSTLDTPEKEYSLIKSSNLPASWLVRYDALLDPNIVAFLKTLDNKQDIGIFFEVTPSFAKDAGVTYNQSQDWHYAKSILLIGYSPSDRQKLIDTAFSKFQNELGFTPKSVGAWWIDANSLSYMRDKYGINTNLDVADQFSTDQYQVWGQYWSSPFYPAKNNALMPADDISQKIGVVTMQWATRDPYNAYGDGDLDSTYSVQANDYTLHNLDSSYFKKLLDVYPETTVGLENDFSFDKFGSEYSNQINILINEQKSGLLKINNMSGFANGYKFNNPGIDPNVLIVSNDPLGGKGKVVWYQTPKYRVGWFYGNYGSVIRDLREYDNSTQENCFSKACDSLDLADSFISSIDDVRLNNGWIVDQGNINQVKVVESNNKVVISYNNQAGEAREIQLLPNDIRVNGTIKTIPVAILDASVNKPVVIKPKAGTFSPEFSYKSVLLEEGLGFAKFLLLTLLFFILPGWVISKNFLVSIPVGWSLFTLLSFVLGYLHFDQVIWLIPIISLLVLLRNKPKFHFKFEINKQIVLASALIFVGSVFWLITVGRSGLPFNYGLGFWGPNGHDGIWHLSLISELKQNIPPENPVFAGNLLSNYHYFFDLLVARSSILFNIDQVDLLFRFFPILISFLVGYLTYKLSRLIFNNYLASLLSIFFIYFGGSFGWILSYINNRTLGGESLFWAQQSFSTLLNPPFAISLVLLFSGLFLFYKYLSEKPKNYLGYFIPIILLWGTLIEFKAYAGVLILISLALYAVELYLKEKRRDIVILAILCCLTAALVFVPNNLNSQSLFIFSPLWFIQTMIISQDRLNWVRLGMIIQSHSIIKLVLGYGLGIAIFIVGNMGTRIFGGFDYKVLIKNRLLIYISTLGLIIPLFFIQKGTSWNSLQFFYYSLIVFDFFASFAIVKFLNNKTSIFKVGTLFLVVLLTIPTTIGNLDQYLPIRPPAELSKEELQALNFLKEQPNGTVLTIPFNSNLKNNYVEPVPLFAYAPTGYVSAFSGHPTFVDDTINLDILAADYKGRIDDENDFLKIPDKDKEILKRDKISYIYLPKDYHFEFDNGKMGIQPIFENDEVIIYQVI